MIKKQYADFAWEQTAALLAIDSPSGFTQKAAVWVKDAFSGLGFDANITNKGGVLVDFGGDEGIINELYNYLNGDYKGFCAADIDTSVKNHLIVFATEKARRGQTVENVDAFFEGYGIENTYIK